MIYRLGDISIDAASRLVTRGAIAPHLTRKAFDLLLLLIERRPSVVSKDEIHSRLWADTFVSESSVQALISEIRQALDDRDRSIIRTVHGVGYALGVELTAGPADERSQNVARAWLLADNWRVAIYHGDNIVGRAGGDVVTIDLPGISRRHARISVGDGVILEDLGSKNGTWLHDQRVTSPVALSDGDQVRLGSILFTFRLAREVDSTDTQAW
jgi:DNA-binding winged helix-turn-helix (wHTH) protein